ncbi:MAG: hypothetical protein ACFFAL_07650 [Promethearchaeota archaeon]
MYVETTSKRILEWRNSRSDFRKISDFLLKRQSTNEYNKKQIELVNKNGAMDRFKKNNR